MKTNNTRETANNASAPTTDTSTTNFALQRTLGRLMAVMMATVGALAAAIVLLTFSSCTSDDDGPDTDWYMSGTWQNTSYPDEAMVFYSNGTGYWQSMSSGNYLEFDYYCFGNGIYFTMYPTGGAPYTIDAYIDVVNSGNMSITWPPSSMYGSTTIYYTRMD